MRRPRPSRVNSRQVFVSSSLARRGGPRASTVPTLPTAPGAGSGRRASGCRPRRFAGFGRPFGGSGRFGHQPRYAAFFTASPIFRHSSVENALPFRTVDHCRVECFHNFVSPICWLVGSYQSSGRPHPLSSQMYTPVFLYITHGGFGISGMGSFLSHLSQVAIKAFEHSLGLSFTPAFACALNKAINAAAAAKFLMCQFLMVSARLIRPAADGLCFEG